MSTQVVHGTPRAFDAFLRPAVRGAQLFFGILLTLPLLWYQLWWWLPVPLAVSFLLYEVFFWARADKPLKLTLEPDRIVVEDRFLQSHATFWLRDVDSATLCYRDLPDGQLEAVLVLASTTEILVALSLHLPRQAFTPRPHDVDLDVCNAVLGAISGVIRALAPRERMIRQPLGEATALEWFRNNLPADAWERTTVRCWAGEAPELDLFGYHQHAHDGLIRLADGRVWLPGADPMVVEPASPVRAERRAVLFRMDGEAHEEAPEQLPLWLQPLGSRTVAIPATLVDPELPERSLSNDLLHMHAPEGAVLLWHLWRTHPADRWPPPWSDALRHARVNVDHWPEALPLPGAPDDG